MKNLLIPILFLFANSAFAQVFDVKPGLWHIDMTVEADGKKTNPIAELENSMAQMPEEQKKKMMEMMKETSGISPFDLSKNCLTKEMIKEGALLGKDKKYDHCDYKVSTQTKTKVISGLTCIDGSKINMEWTLISATQFKGRIMTEKSGKQGIIDYQAKFLSDKCN